ncbi:MAG: hypothetical protein ACE5JH_10795, partial [Acidobacteriota bacterium]
AAATGPIRGAGPGGVFAPPGPARPGYAAPGRKFDRRGGALGRRGAGSQLKRNRFAPLLQRPALPATGATQTKPAPKQPASGASDGGTGTGSGQPSEVPASEEN